MPGENIIFNIGICTIFDNIDKQVMYLNHEIHHVLLRHSLSQASKRLLNMILLGFSFFSFEFGFYFAYPVKYLGLFYRLKQSQYLESRADKRGLKILQVAGFEVNEAPKMVLLFKALEMIEDNSEFLDSKYKKEEANVNL